MKKEELEKKQSSKSNLLQKIGFGTKEPEPLTAEKAWCESMYGESTYKTIENRILDGTEVEQPLPTGRKVLAGTHGFRFALDSVAAEDRFLCRNPQHIENAAGNVLADTAIGIRQFCWLPVPGGRELQHIDLANIRNRDLASVGSVISAPRDDSAACKVNHCFPPNKNFFRR